jgi:hypothetical protein
MSNHFSAKMLSTLLAVVLLSSFSFGCAKWEETRDAKDEAVKASADAMAASQRAESAAGRAEAAASRAEDAAAKAEAIFEKLQRK